jgi:hypothetical protein
MNLWKCDWQGCSRTCVGTGGAIGLRAIGWYFVPGFRDSCFCPAHRPDPVECLESDRDSCPECAGELESDRWQGLISADLGLRFESHQKFMERMRRR